LDLSGRKLGPLSAAIIAVCVKKNTVLEVLNLDNNNLTDDGFDMSGLLKLAEALPYSQLTSLSLDGNELCCGGDMSGILKLAEALPHSQLTSLNLDRNHLTNWNNSPDQLDMSGIIKLAEMLPHSQLTSLSLDENNLCLGGNMSGLLKLAEALPHSQLTSLSLANNALCGIECYDHDTYTAVGINTLCDALKGNSTLTSLNLKHNSLDGDAKQAIRAAKQAIRAAKQAKQAIRASHVELAL